MTMTMFLIFTYIFFCIGAIWLGAKYLELRKYEKENQLPGKPSRFALVMVAVWCFATYSLMGDLTHSPERESLNTVRYEKAADNTEFSIPGVGKVKYLRLFSEVSEEGESMDAFALRVAPKLRQYSDENGYEACGVIATNGESFSIIVGTNFANMVCVNSSRFVMNGYQHAGATLHSHGRQGRFRPTKTDLMLMESTFAGQRANLAMVHGQALNAFSNEDVQSGPGYLAGENGKLFYQGNGTFKEVK